MVCRGDSFHAITLFCMVTPMSNSQVPLVEPTTLDEFYDLDIAHERALQELTANIRQIIHPATHTRMGPTNARSVVGVSAFNKTLTLEHIYSDVDFSKVTLTALHNLGFSALHVISNFPLIQTQIIDLKSHLARTLT